MQRYLFWFALALCLVLAFIGLRSQIKEPAEASRGVKSRPIVKVNSKAGESERPLYQIRANYDDQSQQITGKMAVTLPKMRPKKLQEIYFHLYPNAFQNWKWEEKAKPKKPGYLKVSDIKVNGISATHQIKETLLKVKLSEVIPAGKPVQVEMSYELQLPEGGTRLNAFKKSAFLAQWYPMLAVYDEKGWHTDPYTTIGDPFYSLMSDFEVTFHVPEGYRLITSAEDTKTNTMPVTLRQANVRDFAAVISRDYQVLEGKAGDTKVNVWYLKGMEEVAPTLHDAAISSMKYFSKQFGPYPYREVDVVLGETGHGIAGMEYPGLVTSVPKIPTRNGPKPAINVVAHELAHQWWYGIVGNNQVKEPWLDEGLTTFSEMLFMSDQMGEDEGELLQWAVERSDEIFKEKGITSAEPLYKYSDPVYGIMVYTRPAAMMWELMDDIGEEKVLEILRTYYNQYKYRIATTEDFIRVANEVAEKDLSSFFGRWLYFDEKQVSGE